MPDSADRKPITYWDYIRVAELLDLQGGIDRDESQLSQDEVVFITVHQVYELWFKLVLRDLTQVRDLFKQSVVPDDSLAGARRLLDRVRTTMQVMTDHFRVVETITTRDFLDFRDKLFPANGGQSSQFREVEILFGIEEDERIPYVTGGSYMDVLAEPDGTESWAQKRARERLADRPHLREAVDGWLYRTPINGSGPDDDGDDDAITGFIESYLRSHAQVLSETQEHMTSMTGSSSQQTEIRARYDGEASKARAFLRGEDIADPEARTRRRRIRAAALFIEVYRELPLLSWPREILDGLLAVEHAYVTFRQRHARMAERVIGRRIGTGGSSGVDYLDQSAQSYRVFRDLWAVRTFLLQRARVPDSTNPGFYGFRFHESPSAT